MTFPYPDFQIRTSSNFQEMQHILVIYTGGTIGMVKDPRTGTFVPFDFELIARNLPDLARSNYKLTVHSFEKIIDSSDMEPSIWLEMVRIIRENYSVYDGFVILHGSDTMSFSASMLSFMLEGLQKPVIFSGSQLPIGEIPRRRKTADRSSRRSAFFSTTNCSAATVPSSTIQPSSRPFARPIIRFWPRPGYTSSTIGRRCRTMPVGVLSCTAVWTTAWAC